MAKQASNNTLPDQVARYFFEKNKSFHCDTVKRELFPNKTNAQIQNILSRLERMPWAYHVEVTREMIHGRIHRVFKVLSIVNTADKKNRLSLPYDPRDAMTPVMKLALGYAAC